MNEWSEKRKRIIFGLIVSAVILLIALPSYLLFYKSPTCFDGKKNGDETGVDCGGSCELICPAESLPLMTQGDPRIISIGDQYYEVVAVVKNPNVSAEVRRARYMLTLYDASATPLRTIEAFTYIPKNSTFVIFEGPLDMGETKPVRAVLEWRKDSLIWQKNTDKPYDLEVESITLSKEETEPRVDATLSNNLLSRVENIELIALVSSEEGNLIAASKTFVEELDGGESVPIVFTWPRPFFISDDLAERETQTEIVVRVLPNLSYVR